MISQQYADELFNWVLEALPDARRQANHSILFRDAELNCVVREDNVNILITEHVLVAVLQRHGAQAVEGKMFDFNPHRTPLRQAAETVVMWLKSYGGVSHWVPLPYRMHALALAVNNVREGPVFDYIVTCLKALDQALAQMQELNEEMRAKYATAQIDPRHVADSQLVKQRIEEHAADIAGGRKEVDELLRSLGIGPATQN